MNHHQHKYFLPITIEAVCGGNYSTAHTTMNALYLLALEFRTRFPLAGKRVHTYTQDWGVSDVEACLALSSTHLQRVYLVVIRAAVPVCCAGLQQCRRAFDRRCALGALAHVIINFINRVRTRLGDRYDVFWIAWSCRRMFYVNSRGALRRLSLISEPDTFCVALANSVLNWLGLLREPVLSWNASLQFFVCYYSGMYHLKYSLVWLCISTY